MRNVFVSVHLSQHMPRRLIVQGTPAELRTFFRASVERYRPTIVIDGPRMIPPRATSHTVVFHPTTRYHVHSIIHHKLPRALATVAPTVLMVTSFEGLLLPFQEDEHVALLDSIFDQLALLTSQYECLLLAGLANPTRPIVRQKLESYADIIVRVSDFGLRTDGRGVRGPLQDR